MIIKSNKNGKETPITEEDWTLMEGNGLSRNFTIISRDAPMPEVVANLSYEGLLKSASEAFKKQEFEKALMLFKQVLSIKETPFVRNKISELENKIAEATE